MTRIALILGITVSFFIAWYKNSDSKLNGANLAPILGSCSQNISHSAVVMKIVSRFPEIPGIVQKKFCLSPTTKMVIIFSNYSWNLKPIDCFQILHSDRENCHVCSKRMRMYFFCITSSFFDWQNADFEAFQESQSFPFHFCTRKKGNECRMLCWWHLHILTRKGIGGHEENTLTPGNFREYWYVKLQKCYKKYHVKLAAIITTCIGDQIIRKLTSLITPGSSSAVDWSKPFLFHQPTITNFFATQIAQSTWEEYLADLANSGHLFSHQEPLL